MAGLFFYLASVEGAGLLFLPGCNIALYKRLHRVLLCQCNYIAHALQAFTRLYIGVSYDCTRSTAHDTSPTQAAIIPPATRWRAYTQPDALHRYQIPPPRKDTVQVSTAAYYNKVYKRADHISPAESRYLPRPAAGRSGTGSAVNHDGLAVWHPPPGGAVQQQGQGGRRGIIGGSRRISFRAFAR